MICLTEFEASYLFSSMINFLSSQLLHTVLQKYLAQRIQIKNESFKSNENIHKKEDGHTT